MSTTKIPRRIEQLSARLKLSRWIKNLSRSYRDKFQIALWIEDAIRFVEKRSPRVSIDSYLSRIYQEAVELDKKQFYKERKNTHKWMQSSKLLNQRSKQHFKLSNTSLNQKKCEAFMIQNAHTHALNKSNQFYISKTSQDSLMSIHLHMYPLWCPNYIVLAHVSKVAKNMRVVCENIARVYKCLKLWWFEVWENQF